MSLTDVKNLFGFIAGLGLFLYGMKILSAGLQKAAGEKMKSLLGAVTSKRGMAILVGALITAIIQSSGAPTSIAIPRFDVTAPRSDFIFSPAAFCKPALRIFIP